MGTLPVTAIPPAQFAGNSMGNQNHGEYCFMDTATGSSNILVIFVGNYSNDQISWRILFPGHHYQGQ